MVLNVLNRDVPSFDRVTLFAASPHLPAVHISVAVGAFVSNIGEDWLGVTLGTGDVLVHATQRIASPVVIELGNCANRFPAQGCVAVLTGDVQISVRTACLRRHVRAGARASNSEQRQRQRHSGQKSYGQGLPQPRGLNSDHLVSYEFRTSMTKGAMGTDELCNSTPSQSTS